MSASRVNEAAWALVFAVALALATLAARMMARARHRGADGWTAPQRVERDYCATVARQPSAPGNAAPVTLDVAPVEGCDVEGRAPVEPPSRRTDDPALALLAWLAALGWVTFNGAPPQRWPWWDERRARVWAATFTSALPPMLR